MGTYKSALVRGGEAWYWPDEWAKAGPAVRRWMLQNESTDFTLSTTHVISISLTIGDDEGQPERNQLTRIESRAD